MNGMYFNIFYYEKIMNDVTLENICFLKTNYFRFLSFPFLSFLLLCLCDKALPAADFEASPVLLSRNTLPEEEAAFFPVVLL